ncbi:MAG: methionyl-tRNA formyltransferase [Gemmatimonadota bacterium]
MRILFWGTPDFAIPSFSALSEEGYEIAGVVTQPDRPAGRGRKLRPSPVKEAALAEGVPVLEPERPRGAAFLGELRALEPDLSVVVAYGHILHREVLDLPPLGSINVHASLLPRLRGAAPVNWAIIRGHPRTGVTIMRMAERMDAGPILLQTEEPIGPTQTAAELYLRLAEVGAGSLLGALAMIETEGLEEREQDDSEATFAPKITRELARIDWTLPAPEVSNWIRGMDAVPGAWTELEGEPVKLFLPRPAPDHRHGEEPGTIIGLDPTDGILVATGRGAVRLLEIQPPGRKRMEAGAWIAGRGAKEGQRFE